MHMETSYIDALTNFKNNPNEAKKTEVLNKGSSYGKMLGLSDTESNDMINNDLSRLTT